MRMRRWNCFIFQLLFCSLKLTSPLTCCSIHLNNICRVVTIKVLEIVKCIYAHYKREKERERAMKHFCCRSHFSFLFFFFKQTRCFDGVDMRMLWLLCCGMCDLKCYLSPLIAVWTISVHLFFTVRKMFFVLNWNSLFKVLLLLFLLWARYSQ